MRLGVFSALVAAALVTLHGDVSSSSVATAAVTCPLNYQTRLGSSLSTPMREEPDSKNSNKKDDKNNKNSKNKKKGSGSGSSNADVGDNDVGKGSGRGSGSGAGGVPRSTAPGVTTAAPTGVPSSTAPTSLQPSSSSPPATSAAPSSTRPTTTRPATTNGSNGGGEAGVPRGRVHGARRFLQANPPATTAPGTSRPAGLPDAGAPTATPTPPPTGTLAPGATTPAPAESNKSSSNNSTSGGAFTCDENFYKQWESNGIKCNGVSLDVAQAVAASRCVIYSGALGAIEGTSCVSICAFPACVNGQWDYSATNGISSEVYRSVGITKFMSAELTAEISKRTSGGAVLVGNTTLASTKQCDYASEDSFAACSCSKISKDAPKSDAEIKKERQEDRQNGIISKDDTTTAGSIIAPTSQSVAGVTVFMSSVAAVASTVVSGSSAATASVAAAGANVAVVTVEICQFTVLINQLKLEGKSAALALFGKQMAPSAFTFLPFGKMEDGPDDTKKGGRRLAAQTTADAGVSSYSRTLGIREDMLFVVTLAGVIVVMAGVVGLFGIAYGLSGLFMSREDFMNKFFDKMIGLQVLIAILSQYTIGVTATYQIHFSFQQNNPTDPKCILAIISLLVLAFGVIIYGYIVVKKHEDEIKDVGTATHINKKVCLRYGPLYEEYKYKHRFFFAAKMMLALVSGAATGYVAMEAKYQVSIILAAHVIFFFYLEMKAPHHSKFVQTTTSFVTIMKIATLALTFFLISAAASSDLPSELQNGISLAIVGLNLFVLFLLMVRSLYAFWKKYQLQRDAKFEEEEQSAAQEYFKDDTPARKNRVPKEQNPYLMGNAVQHDYNDAGDDIRLRSGTHMQESGNRYSYGDSAPRYDPSRSGGAQHYIANQRDTQPQYQHQQHQQQQQYHHQYQQVDHHQQYRRNDVVEL